MAVIVIHAGMPKAGSSSVQMWLRSRAAELGERRLTVLVPSEKLSAGLNLVPYEKGSVNSSRLVDAAIGRPAAEQDLAAEALGAALASAAERYGDVVVSGESFAHPFWTLHAPTLAALQHLSEGHEVRVAYYARPQHTALEAAWRQWGYRSGQQPSEYVARRAAYLRYATTRTGVRSLAPGLRFEPRPFRADLLDGGDVVADFGRRFLGWELGPGESSANLGLPLEVVNALRGAPAGMFRDRPVDNSRLERIKALLADSPLPEDERIALSRQILRKYAHASFAAENAELGWSDFVPPPDDPDGIPGLEALDELWRPQASPAELSLLFRALQASV